MAKKKKKKRIRKKPQGKPVRLSDEVIAFYNRRKKSRESVDAFFRRLLGMPTKKGDPQDLKEYFVVPAKNPVVAKTEAEARGMAIMLAVQNGKRKALKVIKVKEAL